MINPKQFAKDMTIAMAKLKLENEKALLKRMLEDGHIDQSAHDTVRADCNERFINTFDIAEKAATKELK